MTVNIDKLLRTAKTEVKAGRAANIRGEILLALEQFPANARLLSGRGAGRSHRPAPAAF